MKLAVRMLLAVSVGATIALADTVAPARESRGPATRAPAAARLRLPAETPIVVRIVSDPPGARARPGDPWSGVVVASVTIDGRQVVPAGSAVCGIVVRAPGPTGKRHELRLAARTISIGGAPATSLSAATETFTPAAARATILLFVRPVPAS